MDKRTDVSLPLDITEVSEAVIGEKVGYARVSSKEQNLERQTEQLRKEGVFSLYEDRMDWCDRTASRTRRSPAVCPQGRSADCDVHGSPRPFSV